LLFGINWKRTITEGVAGEGYGRRLLINYAKSRFDNLPAEFLARLNAEVERG
jgi:hypothetical protein